LGIEQTSHAARQPRWRERVVDQDMGIKNDHARRASARRWARSHRPRGPSCAAL
jgi:hypothetical protein